MDKFASVIYCFDSWSIINCQIVYYQQQQEMNNMCTQLTHIEVLIACLYAKIYQQIYKHYFILLETVLLKMYPIAQRLMSFESTFNDDDELQCFISETTTTTVCGSV